MNDSDFQNGPGLILFSRPGDQLTSLTFAAPRCSSPGNDVSIDSGRGYNTDNTASKYFGTLTHGPSNNQSTLHGQSDVVERLKFFLATAPSIFAMPISDLAPPAHALAMDTASSSHANPNSVSSSASTALTTSTNISERSLQFNEDQQRFRRFYLPNGEYISCVLWNGLYHITGTDIIRTLVFRFLTFGRRISNMKKFEEGVFSDLRNLKAGIDATLELPKVSSTSKESNKR